MHAELTRHLAELEALLQDQQVRADEARLVELIAEDFIEFGVSGTVWTRPAIVEALRGESFSKREITDFTLTLLADDVALVTYRGHRFATPERPGARSLRSSIWRRREGRWQMLFHQGTALPGD